MFEAVNLTVSKGSQGSGYQLVGMDDLSPELFVEDVTGKQLHNCR